MFETSSLFSFVVISCSPILINSHSKFFNIGKYLYSLICRVSSFSSSQQIFVASYSVKDFPVKQSNTLNSETVTPSISLSTKPQAIIFCPFLNLKLIIGVSPTLEPIPSEQSHLEDLLILSWVVISVVFEISLSKCFKLQQTNKVEINKADIWIGVFKLS